MEGAPLEYVKRACGYVVDLLEPNDVLSIITFEEQVDVVMPARRVVNRALIKEHINRIEPGNTTNLYDGIVAGAAQVAAARSDSAISRIVVLTDGEPTAGLKDFQSIVGLVGEQKTRGITTTVLGFGPDYNEELLAGMARRSGGNYYYIQQPEMIPEVFRREMQTLLTLSARNLRLRATLPRFSTLRQVYGHTPHVKGRTVDLPLPDLERGASISTVMELDLAPRPTGVYRVAKFELVYDDCVTGQGGARAEADAVAEFVADVGRIASGVSPLVQQEVEIARATRSLERTMMGLRTEQLGPAHALAELQRTQMLLAQGGREDEAAEVTQAIQSLRTGRGDVEKTLMGAIVGLDQGKH
jgi:Ca-activated chloride channel homolog